MSEPATPFGCSLCKTPIPRGGEFAVGNGGAYCMTCMVCRRFDVECIDKAATRAGDERIARLNGEAFANADEVELAVWQAHLGPQCLALVERVLAAEGDAADPELIQLQHDLSQLLNSAATKP